jgi:hypothetical protein
MRSTRAGSDSTPRNLLFIALASGILIWATEALFTAAQFNPWDFVLFWGAGQALNAGLDPYQVNIAHVPGQPGPFFSPIFIAESFRPIAALLPSVMQAKLIWTAVNGIGGVALSITIVYLSKLRMSMRTVVLAVTLLVTFEPFTAAMRLGQTVIFVVLAVAISWLLIESRRLFLAGLVFCLGASNPHLIVGVGVYYLYRAIVRREPRLLLGMGTGAIGLVLCCALYPTYTVEWLTHVLPVAQAMSALDPVQITLIRLTVACTSIAGLSPSSGIHIGTLVTAAVSLLSLAAAVMVWRRNNGQSMAIDMSAAVVLSFMATTYAFHQDYMLLTLLVPSAVTVWRDAHSVRKVGYLVVCGATLLFSSLPAFVGFAAPNYWLPLVFGWPLLTGLLVLTQLSARPALLQQAMPSALLVLALTFIGDFLTMVDLTWMRMLDISLILFGLLGYLFVMWRWYGRSPRRTDGRASMGASSAPLAEKEMTHALLVNRTGEIYWRAEAVSTE